MTYGEILDHLIQKQYKEANNLEKRDDPDATHNAAMRRCFASWLESVKDRASNKDLNKEWDESQIPMIESEEWERFCWNNGYDLDGHRSDPDEE